MMIWGAGCDISQISKRLRAYLLIFKSCILVPHDCPKGLKHVAFVGDIIKRFLCLTVMCVPILIEHSTTGWIPLQLMH
jgi:hypothetical protein